MFGNANGSNSVEYLVVAGGGGVGGDNGGELQEAEGNVLTICQQLVRTSVSVTCLIYLP